MSKAEINRRIMVTGLRPNYVLRTGGLGGLPYDIDLTDYPTAIALQRTLRKLALLKPELFGVPGQ